MSDMTTIARPYAKAIFDLALDAKQLPDWSDVLALLAQTMLCPEAIQFIGNPAVTADEQTQFLVSVVSDTKHKIDPKLIDGFVASLVAEGRLFVIPGIAIQYEQLRADEEKTMVVTVNSFTPLSDKQQQRLIEMLTKRLERRIALEISIDESLLGGALIQAGDLVIDGSVRGQLTKLASTLAA